MAKQQHQIRQQRDLLRRGGDGGRHVGRGGPCSHVRGARHRGGQLTSQRHARCLPVHVQLAPHRGVLVPSVGAAEQIRG